MPTGRTALATWAAHGEGDAHPCSSLACCFEGRREAGSSRPEKPGVVSAAGKGYASYDFVFSLQIKGQFMSV